MVIFHCSISKSVKLTCDCGKLSCKDTKEFPFSSSKKGQVPQKQNNEKIRIRF